MPPRASLRAREATPARSTRAASTARLDTPATRRSARGASKQSIATKDAVSNPALPEIQTQQSYAYGSSQTPALPEQLHAKSLNIAAVAAHLDDATDEAERNLEARANRLRDQTPDQQAAAREERAQRRSSRQPVQKEVPSSPMPQATPQSGKRNRVADWVQNSSQLDDISEEPRASTEPSEASDGQESLPSSFPEGSFDHSYSYERGERGPVLPQTQNLRQAGLKPGPQLQTQSKTIPESRRQRSVLRDSRSQGIASSLARLRLQLSNAVLATRSFLQQLKHKFGQYFTHVFQMLRKFLLELSQTPAVAIIFKSLVVTAGLSLLALLFCFSFTRYCDPLSTSIVSQNLQMICGTCNGRASVPVWNITDPGDVQQLLAALQQTQTQIAHVESRLNSRIMSNHASLMSDASKLRSHQEALETQIQRLNEKHAPSETTSHEVSSPLIPRINFFSPSNGAVVLPHLTSPTLAQKFFLPIAVALRALRIQKLLSPPPVTALESWLDEGDCWCAASLRPTDESERGKGSTLLTIQTLTRIYPTELVIEHYPATGSLNPNAAPKEIELWADFSRLSFDEWATLHIQDLLDESPNQAFIPGQVNSRETWARIGTAQYQMPIASNSEVDTQSDNEPIEIDAKEAYGQHRRAQEQNSMKARDQGERQNHVQRFNLIINQNGLLHYSDRFMVRVRENYGADFTCLYRVRLHGHTADSDIQTTRRLAGGLLT